MAKNKHYSISLREFVDGFYELSTTIDGRRIAVTYSDKTLGNDAIADFKKFVEDAIGRNKPQNQP